jgi:glycosyltransferase involved in cell wall biosynthesis
VRFISRCHRDYDATIYDAIWIALIRPEKQLEVFLDLAASMPELHFAVVGGFDPNISASERASLEGRLYSLENLKYLGTRRAEEVVDLLMQSRVLVNTSPREGFPNTMLEAWGVGVPVVSLSVDPGRIIERKRLGLVSGSSTQLHRDVSLLARSEALNKQFGCRGLDYVRQQHSAEAVYEALMQAIRNNQLIPADNN